MSIGASTLNTANINTIIGNWAVQLQDMFANIVVFKATLDKIGLAGLEAAPYNFSAGDAQALINAYNDLNTLANVYYGLEYIVSGATVNTGVPTANSAGHFGYNFSITIGLAAGIGF